MKLPATFDPEAVRLASIAVRYALSDSRFDHFSAADRQAVVENGVGKMMAAGAYVQDGRLFFPAGITANDL